jgi:hypothetical protein
MDQSPSGACHNITADFIECADPTGCGVGPNAWAWDYQVNLFIFIQNSTYLLTYLRILPLLVHRSPTFSFAIELTYLEVRLHKVTEEVTSLV